MRFLVLVPFIFSSCVSRQTNLPPPVVVTIPSLSTEAIGKHIDDLEKDLSSAHIRSERIKILLNNLYEK